MVKKFRILALALLATASTVVASPLTTEQIDSLTNAANSGNVRAMYELGVANSNGDGMMVDGIKAYQWWLKAAQHGDVTSMYCLGRISRVIDGFYDYCPADTAIKYLKLAADKGVPQAQYIYYLLADARDATEEFKMMKKAADQGYMPAIASVAYKYSRGNGVTENWNEAVKWAKNAAEKGNIEVLHDVLYPAYIDGKGVAQSDAEAFKIAKILSDNDYTSFYDYVMGYFYEEGGPVEKNIKTAVKYYRKGAAKDNDYCIEALNRLGYSIKPRR